MDRRTFLGLSALGLALPILGQTLPASAKPAGRVLYALPKSNSPRMAWTVDDGFSEKTVAGYVNLLKDNPDLKITFFVTSAYATWRRHEDSLNYLISNGQVQLANHTHTHKDLTSLSTKRVKYELSTCRQFLEDHFDVSGRPFYRPPYGSFNNKVRDIAADLGYIDTVMWFGTLADAGRNTERGLLRNANRWMKDRAILISHANYPEIIGDFDEILALIAKRDLKMVTLDEVYG